MEMIPRSPYVWDYDIDANTFLDILAGRRAIGRLNKDWAAQRLIEYAPYEEIIKLIGYKSLVENWPRWRGKIRSKSRVRGLDFLVSWLPKKHPVLLHVYFKIDEKLMWDTIQTDLPPLIPELEKLL